MPAPKAILKSPGQLIDELSIVNLKIWHWMDKELDESLSEHERFESGQTVLKLNKRRSELIEAIDYYFNVTTINPKTY